MPSETGVRAPNCHFEMSTKSPGNNAGSMLDLETTFGLITKALINHTKSEASKNDLNQLFQRIGFSFNG